MDCLRYGNKSLVIFNCDSIINTFELNYLSFVFIVNPLTRFVCYCRHYEECICTKHLHLLAFHPALKQEQCFIKVSKFFITYIFTVLLAFNSCKMYR